MKSVYLVFLLCTGVSLTFLSAYFSIIYTEYIDSIFYIVNMMLFSSVVLIMFLESRTINLVNKLFILSCVFLVLYFSSIIIQNMFIFTNFGLELLDIFSIFFLMCSVSLMLLSSIAVNNESMLSNTNSILLIFSPLVFFAIWILVNTPLLSNTQLESTTLNLFLLFFVNIYSILIMYNVFKSVGNVLTIKSKFLITYLGLFIVFVSSGLRVAGVFSELTSIFSLLGVFIFCLGLLVSSSLSIFNFVFSALINNLNGKKKEDFLKYLNASFKRKKDLIVKVNDKGISISDNPKLDDIDEKKSYERSLISSLKWYRKHVKGSSVFIKELKKFYNRQVIMTRKLNQFLI